ncbi:hypothetical protein JCM10212_002352 [Sporobolomyces blumeae]
MSAPNEPNTFDRSTTAQDLLDALDGLLEDYLGLVSTYEAHRRTLEGHLKTAHFSLAKAKLAIGPARLGRDAWDLAERESDVRVVVTQGETTTVERDAPDRQHWALEPRPAVVVSEPPSTRPVSTLRSRSSRPGSIDPTEPPTESEPPRRTPRSPLEQFTSLPPPALRSASTSFSAALEHVVRVADVAREMTRLESQIRRVKERLGERGERREAVVD